MIHKKQIRKPLEKYYRSRLIMINCYDGNQIYELGYNILYKSYNENHSKFIKEIFKNSGYYIISMSHI